MTTQLAAIAFIREWAETHHTYTGDQILEAYRLVGGPEGDAGRGSRLNWGQMMQQAESKGIHKTIGRVKPRSKHSHIASTCLRMSLILKGEPPSEAESAKHYVTQLWNLCAQREMTLKKALWAAYTYGVESS